MADSPQLQVSNVYADNFAIAVGPYGAALTFALTAPELAGDGSPRTLSAVTVRMSLEHLKVITWMAHRQVANYQQEYNLQIPLPDRALESVGANREQWRKFWGE